MKLPTRLHFAFRELRFAPICAVILATPLVHAQSAPTPGSDTGALAK